MWFMGYHHEISRRKHTPRICLRNALFRNPNDFNPALDPKPGEDICNNKRAIWAPDLFYSFPLLVYEKEMYFFSHSQSQVPSFLLTLQDMPFSFRALPKELEEGKTYFPAHHVDTMLRYC